MKILGISGSPVERGTYFLLEQALNAASEKGAETELIKLIDYKLEFCQACNNCLKDKKCIIEDDLGKIAEKLINADGIIIGSPSYFGSVTAIMKNFMDRSRYLKMTNHTLKDKFLGAIATSGLNQGGAQSTIETIHFFGLLHAMIIVGPAGRPETEANMVVGTLERDEGWRNIKKDIKAIKLARNLGERMSDLILKMLE
jgi:multimeric flavodoxin WrbA